MTIKELCNNHNRCSNCPFFEVCALFEDYVLPMDFIDYIDEEITSAIIKTANILTGSNINGNENKENL